VTVFTEALRQFATKTAARAAFTQALKTQWDSRPDSTQPATERDHDHLDEDSDYDDEDDNEEEEEEEEEEGEEEEQQEEEEEKQRTRKRKRNRRKKKRKINSQEVIDEEIEEAKEELVLLTSSGAGLGVGGFAGSLCDASAQKVLHKLLAKAYEWFLKGGPAVVLLDIGSGDGIMLERALRSTTTTLVRNLIMLS
jgi:flagellar biosynthesis GTPase FlhF